MIQAYSEISWKSGTQIENVIFLLFEVWKDGKLAMVVTGMEGTSGTAIKNYDCSVPFECRTRKPPIWRVFFKSNFEHVSPLVQKCTARQINGDETNFSKLP